MVVDLVNGWPDAKKHEALDGARANLGNGTEMAAFAIEGFSPSPEFRPVGDAPSMAAYDPSIVARRGDLVPLLDANDIVPWRMLHEVRSPCGTVKNAP